MCEVDKSLASDRVGFVIFIKATKFTEPRESPLDYPAPRLDSEPFLVRIGFNNF